MYCFPGIPCRLSECPDCRSRMAFYRRRAQKGNTAISLITAKVSLPIVLLRTDINNHFSINRSQEAHADDVVESVSKRPIYASISSRASSPKLSHIFLHYRCLEIFMIIIRFPAFPIKRQRAPPASGNHRIKQQHLLMISKRLLYFIALRARSQIAARATILYGNVWLLAIHRKADSGRAPSLCK